MEQINHYFATCPKGVDDLLVQEFEQLKLDNIKATIGGVHFDGDIEDAYRACLWSRTASRVLLQLNEFNATDYDDVYDVVQQTDWSEHFSEFDTFAIDCFSSSETMNNSHFATLKVKDAIVDQFKDKTGERPDVGRDRPDVRINVYLSDKQCFLYIDLSGEPLHKRGYRVKTGEATLKENLAAAIVLRSKYKAIAEQGKPLIDPMCGTGTLLVEAAYIAADIAPGLLRDYYGFIGWKQHQPELWQKVYDEALDGLEERKANLPAITGMDISERAIEASRENIKAAMLQNNIQVIRADCIEEKNPDAGTDVTGMIITNPPYGERLGDVRTLSTLYHNLGQLFKTQYAKWEACVFTSNHELARNLGLRAYHKNSLYNGPLKCTLYRYHIGELSERAQQENEEVHKNAEMFANRLAKNYKHLGKWAKRNNIQCYRIYDADIPQYAVAIDIYNDKVHVQEYEAPKSVNEVKAYQRLSDVMHIISNTLGVSVENTVLKTRKKQKGTEQYTKVEQSSDKKNHFELVTENDLRFQINLHEYLDTGLFIDHRNTRQLIKKLSDGKSFLNLFAYTGAVTVYAAAGGARSSTTVDMSNTYIEWAEKNVMINKLDHRRHRFIREDCMQWLWDENRAGGTYDLIFLDPPTFSNSKKMQESLDIKRDHADLIDLTMKLLEENGLLVFSTNAKKFKLDKELADKYFIKDITSITTTEDFKRKPAHKCWLLAKQEAALDFKISL